MLIPGDSYNPWCRFVGCIIPNAVSRCTELSSTAKLVFGKLCQYAGQNGQAYPSYKTLAGDVGVERRQAIRAVKELVDYGLIKPVSRRKGDGGFTSNIYAFIWHQIFSDNGSTASGDICDTRGGVTNVTTPQCHLRHHLVSTMTPKENHTKESNNEKTTTEQIRLLLSDTPLSSVSENTLEALIKRHGVEKVAQAADIAAQTWLRERKEIRNPGGYLRVICDNLIAPEWYEPPEERAAKAAASVEKKEAEIRTLEIHQAKAEQETIEREKFWYSLSAADRQNLLTAFKADNSYLEGLSHDFVESMAKISIWNTRTQMDTNMVSSASIASAN